jgi:hypothetical protein
MSDPWLLDPARILSLLFVDSIFLAKLMQVELQILANCLLFSPLLVLVSLCFCWASYLAYRNLLWKRALMLFLLLEINP